MRKVSRGLNFIIFFFILVFFVANVGFKREILRKGLSNVKFLFFLLFFIADIGVNRKVLNGLNYDIFLFIL